MIVRQLETRLTTGDIAPRSLSNIKNAIQSMAELYLDAKGPGAWRLRWFRQIFFQKDLSESNSTRPWHHSEQLFWIPHHCHVQGCRWPSESKEMMEFAESRNDILILILNGRAKTQRFYMIEVHRHRFARRSAKGTFREMWTLAKGLRKICERPDSIILFIINL